MIQYDIFHVFWIIELCTKDDLFWFTVVLCLCFYDKKK